MLPHFIVLLMITMSLLQMCACDLPMQLGETFNLPPSDSQPLKIAVRLTVISVAAEEHSGTFIITGTLVATWNDKRLQWNSDGTNNKTGQVQWVISTAGKLWYPPLNLVNAAEDRIASFFTYNSTAVIFQNGVVKLYYSGDLSTSCNMNYIDFPYDSQRCDVVIGAGFYSDQSIMLYEDAAINIDEVSSYIFTKVKAETATSVQQMEWYSQSRITYIFRLTRDAAIYIYTVFVPVSLLEGVQMGSLLMPVSGDRLNFQVTTFLAMTFVFTSSILDQIPPTSEVINAATFAYVQIILSSVTPVYTAFAMFVCEYCAQTQILPQLSNKSVAPIGDNAVRPVSPAESNHRESSHHAKYSAEEIVQMWTNLFRIIDGNAILVHLFLYMYSSLVYISGFNRYFWMAIVFIPVIAIPVIFNLYMLLIINKKQCWPKKLRPYFFLTPLFIVNPLEEEESEHDTIAESSTGRKNGIRHVPTHHQAITDPTKAKIRPTDNST